MRFGSDQVLLYNVEPWSQLGFGVPAFGDNLHTLNKPAHRLANEIGQLQLFIMTHIDATRTRPPSKNTLVRLGRMMNRIRNVLGGRARAYSDLRVEPGHGSPAPAPWIIHPVPYFHGPIVRNGFLAEYNELTMIALANIYQHSDNNLSLTITEEFAGDVWLYFNEIKRLIGGELLSLAPEVYEAETFTFTDEHYNAYAPDKVTIRIEALDHPGSVTQRFTEDDLRPFLTGIPANLIVPNIVKFPVGPDDNFGGAKGGEITDSVVGLDQIEQPQGGSGTVQFGDGTDGNLGQVI